MKRLLVVALILGVTVVAIPAHADGPGVSLALRSGFSLPVGEISTAQPLSNRIMGNVPLQLDAGYRFDENIFAGAYFQYGLGFINGLSFVRNCPSTASCTSSVVRFGIEGIYKFFPQAVIAPWAGLGLGYEILNTSFAGFDSSVRGFEFFNLQVGGDYSVSSFFTIGPFAQFSLAKYSKAGGGGGAPSTDINSTSLHGWWQFGLKGTFQVWNVSRGYEK